MADRTVAVRLLAKVDSYKRNMTDAAATTKKFGTDIAAATKTGSDALAEVSTESTIVGGALLALAAGSVVAMAGFEKSMSGVKAVSGATAGEMEKLRQAALDAGEATVFSASQAADAEAELAKAGVSTADILGGALRGSLDLAAAGNLDLAQSATIAAQAMNVFDLKGQDVAHVADVLAAGANKSAADVAQLGDAMSQSGLVAKQTGLSLEDTVGVLSAFADNALIGSDAGTSLKTMLQRLTPQSAEAEAKMAELGISAYDASGQFVGLEKFAGNLQTAMEDLTPEARASAMAVIFGSDAVRAANVLYDLGETGVRDYTRAVNDQGAASRMAADQLDNLAGDFEQLSGSLETTFIKSGSTANGLLREMTQGATDAVNFIGDLPAPILATATAAAVAGGAFFVAAPRVAAFNASLAATPALAKGASAALRLIGPALGVAAVASLALDIQASNEELDNLQRELADLYKVLDTDIDSASITTLKQRIQELQDVVADPGVIRYFKQGIEMIAGAPGEINRSADLLQEARSKYADYQAAVGEVAYAIGVDFTRAMELLDESGVNLDGTTAEIIAGVRAYVAASQDGGSASVKASEAMDALTDSTMSAEDQLKAYTAAWDATIGMMLGVSDAEIAAEEAVDRLTDSIKENGNVWDINKEKGRANLSAWNDLVDAAGRVREKKLEEGASVDEANEAYRKYLEQVRDAPGLTDKERAAVQKLIDKYDELPAEKTTTVDANTEPAKTAVRDLKAWIAAQRATIKVDAKAGTVGTGGGRATVDSATGGYITGPGTSTSDSIAARLSNGEYVIKAKSVDQYGVGFMDAVNAGRYTPASSGSSIGTSPAGGTTQVVIRGGVPVQLVLDGKVVHTTLLGVKRGNGGLELGLA